MATKQAPTRLERTKAWIAGLTGVLVVMPAVVNAGYDIYAALAKLPKTDAESANEELFRKYFNKQPVAAFPIPVKQNNGTVEVRFSIYEEGDVFVEFGRMTQWFRFPAGRPASLPPLAGSMFISSAFAQPAPAPLRGSGPYAQHDTLQGKLLIRERSYANGVRERMVLETRSGLILQQSMRREPADTAATPKASKPPEIAPIDLDLYRRNQASR